MRGLNLALLKHISHAHEVPLDIEHNLYPRPPNKLHHNIHFSQFVLLFVTDACGHGRLHSFGLPMPVEITTKRL
jgi:hypothetical protein